MVGCSSGDDDQAAGTDVTVEAVLARAAEAMAGVQTAGFSIEHTGADVFIDDAARIRFDGAQGRYAAPSKADAVVEVNAMGITTKVGAITIDGRIWITNPLTDKWEDAPGGLSFDPTVLFDPETGWRSLLSEGLQDPVLVPSGGDDDRHHVRATVAADRVSVLTGGLVDEPSVIDLWIDADTSLVSEAGFDVDTDAGPTSWRLLLRNYGDDVTITAP
jgi:hypothetical protein